ncbi:MAG: hypothetical protein IT431_11755 [Phycisphaerales bacterium]|nr:hypothetical protein [Phycisphaerales bacterium]
MAPSRWGRGCPSCGRPFARADQRAVEIALGSPPPHLRPDDEWLLEQYKLCFDTFNNELQRFWVRFNVLVGVQIAATAAVVSRFSELKGQPCVLLGMSVFMVACGLVTLLVLYRGTIVYAVFVHVLSILEGRSGGRLGVTRLADWLTKHPIRRPYGMWIAAIIPCMVCGFWIWMFVGWFGWWEA